MVVKKPLGVGLSIAPWIDQLRYIVVNSLLLEYAWCGTL